MKTKPVLLLIALGALYGPLLPSQALARGDDGGWDHQERRDDRRDDRWDDRWDDRRDSHPHDRYRSHRHWRPMWHSHWHRPPPKVIYKPVPVWGGRGPDDGRTVIYRDGRH